MYGPWKQVGSFDPDLESLVTATANVEPSMTQQNFGPETDINNIARRYGLTGELPRPYGIAEYGDFDSTMDLQTVLANFRAGEALFRQVPADIRGRFNNEAGVFLEWIHDEANYDEAAELGLVPPSPAVVAARAAAAATPVAPVVP